jgi:hypothetical protein
MQADDFLIIAPTCRNLEQLQLEVMKFDSDLFVYRKSGKQGSVTFLIAWSYISV